MRMYFLFLILIKNSTPGSHAPGSPSSLFHLSHYHQPLTHASAWQGQTLHTTHGAKNLHPKPDTKQILVGLKKQRIIDTCPRPVDKRTHRPGQI